MVDYSNEIAFEINKNIKNLNRIEILGQIKLVNELLKLNYNKKLEYTLYLLENEYYYKDYQLFNYKILNKFGFTKTRERLHSI